MRLMSARALRSGLVLIALAASVPLVWAQSARVGAAAPACQVSGLPTQQDAALLRVGAARAMLALPDAAADPAALVRAADRASANLVLAFDWPEPALRQAREALAMPLGGLHSRPAVPSRLLSAGPEGLRTSSFQVGERDVVVLMQQGANGLRVAASVVAEDMAGHRRTVRWQATGDASLAGGQADLATLEQLYRLVLEQSPEDRFVVHVGAVRARPAMGYADALAALAQVRECVAARVRAAVSGSQPLVWQSVRVTLAQASAAQPLAVAARALDTAGRPIADAQISFARGEHFVCSAPTDAQGWARCTLWDPHGHVLEDDGRDPTLVTFGGQWQDARLLLPTTAVFRSRVAGTRAARHVH